MIRMDLLDGLDALLQPVGEAESPREAAHTQQEVLQHLLTLHCQIHLIQKGKVINKDISIKKLSRKQTRLRTLPCWVLIDTIPAKKVI